MTFHDPSRPRIGGRPCFFSGSILPGLTIIPKTQNTCILCVNLPIDKNSYAQRQVHVAVEDLQWIAAQYTQDPEDTLLRWFQWAPAESQVTSKVSLADLGL